VMMNGCCVVMIISFSVLRNYEIFREFP